MRKYYDPKIKIVSFLSENVVTESGAQKTYIQEVNTLIGKLSTEEYKARIESINNLLTFSE